MFVSQTASASATTDPSKNSPAHSPAATHSPATTPTTTGDSARTSQSVSAASPSSTDKRKGLAAVGSPADGGNRTVSGAGSGQVLAAVHDQQPLVQPLVLFDTLHAKLAVSCLRALAQAVCCPLPAKPTSASSSNWSWSQQRDRLESSLQSFFSQHFQSLIRLLHVLFEKVSSTD